MKQYKYSLHENDDLKLGDSDYCKKALINCRTGLLGERIRGSSLIIYAFSRFCI